jgi:hypothetical protein
MKKTSLFFLTMASILLMTSLSSCSKETSGELTFWYGSDIPTLASLLSVNSFTFYLDGEIIGSSSASVYSTSSPACGSGGAVSKDVDLDQEDSASLPYRVVDEDGDTWWEGTVKIEDGGCQIIELTL